MSKVNFKCRRITLDTPLAIGDVMIIQPSIGLARKVKVTKVTVTMVQINETRYSRNGGYQIGDEYKRPTLFLLTEETVKA